MEVCEDKTRIEDEYHVDVPELPLLLPVPNTENVDVDDDDAEDEEEAMVVLVVAAPSTAIT